MAAVGIPAAQFKRADVGESLLDAFACAKHPHFAHARHFNQQPAIPQHDQLAPCGGVTPLTRMADLAGFSPYVGNSAPSLNSQVLAIFLHILRIPLQTFYVGFPTITPQQNTTQQQVVAASHLKRSWQNAR
jgi:hypothetical protein